MKPILNLKFIIIITLALLVGACGTRVVIKGVDFSQPIEMVIQSDESGQVTDQRTGLSFNISEMLKNEGISRADFAGNQIRMIRNHQGYYFATAAGFKNVYVLESRTKELRSVKVINISSERMGNPALNQRNPYIILVDGGRTYNLTRDGISRQ
jgi:hypothetical protein